MAASQRIREHRDEILRVAALHGAGNVLLFGSVVRGEDTPESDVDLLVDVTGETSPWFPGKPCRCEIGCPTDRAVAGLAFVGRPILAAAAF